MPNDSILEEAPVAGLDPKLASLMTYLFSLPGAAIFYFLSKDQLIRFHAMQSFLVSVLFLLLYIALLLIPFFYWIGPYLVLAYIILTVVMMVKAYKGKIYRLPLIGKISDKNS